MTFVFFPFFFFKVDKVFQRESPAVKTSSTAACLKSLQLQFEKSRLKNFEFW